MGGRIVLTVVLGYPSALSRRVHSPACSIPRYTEPAGAWEIVAAPVNENEFLSIKMTDLVFSFIQNNFQFIL